MKTINILLSMFFVALISGCEKDDAGKIEREAAKIVKDARNHLAAHEDEYIRKIESELTEIDLQIKELNEKAKNSGAETRIEIEREIRELTKKKDAVRKNLHRLKSGGAEALKDAESEINDAMDDLKKSYAKARSRFE